ncbi:MAG: ATP-binding protein [Anaerolineae bacterium]|nr:ATP-binding protein [Anaerolineae bacterium]
MLIRFITRNYLSFNEEVEFSMITGRARKHPNHIIRDKAWNGIDLLRSAVIYGANASGKSNLIKAMSFAQELIINGTKPKQKIPVNYHKLQVEGAKTPSKFEFEFKINGNYYAYGFELDAQKIHSEWLYSISKKSQRMIFERETTEALTVEVAFGDITFEDKEDKQFLDFVAKGTRPNQLFLTESIERNVKHFEDAHMWFDKVLEIIFPDTRFRGLGISVSQGDELSNSLSEYLRLFDTGITGLSLEPVDMDTELSVLPDALRAELITDLTPGKNISLSTPNNRHYILRLNQDEELEVKKLMTKHKMAGCDEEICLEISDESDGTQRLLDLTPGLFDLLHNNRVLVIDELDRSLHPHLSYKLLEHFLNSGTGQESQLIVTTHESHLLDLDLLRRDEIWFVEKSGEGASNIYSLEEFMPRYDKDIQKGYLLGRFGAIPIIGNVSELEWAKE